ncbi:hypothetical protein N6H18_14925 [Reichenbachiella agarivorans]|uniref:Uncharacterized protein n=1 Tax=Reichenbachiella agarivorans TaxID=2979464 RepID=A0ABY6CM97_9BACT|nr:hypothetical protein [Reichenbachiella agarivorans]UXP31640.1 hypothetical protein N6H18_14925 [Reichenbachiella agarivorans]
MENLSEILGAFIVLAPILIFVIVMMIVRRSFKNNGIHLTDMLTEMEVSVPAEGDNPAEHKKSASRLILFLSGVTSLILSVCITTFYFYMKVYCVNCSVGLDLSDFTNVILALGIGVIPYSVNQVKKIRL